MVSGHLYYKNFCKFNIYRNEDTSVGVTGTDLFYSGPQLLWMRLPTTVFSQKYWNVRPHPQSFQSWIFHQLLPPRLHDSDLLLGSTITTTRWTISTSPRRPLDPARKATRLKSKPVFSASTPCPHPVTITEIFSIWSHQKRWSNILRGLRNRRSNSYSSYITSPYIYFRLNISSTAWNDRGLFGALNLTAGFVSNSWSFPMPIKEPSAIITANSLKISSLSELSDMEFFSLACSPLNFNYLS